MSRRRRSSVHYAARLRRVVLGEVMLELRPADGQGSYDLAYAGDTFNTAVQLSRLGIAISYVTMLGRDPFSDAIVERAIRLDFVAKRTQELGEVEDAI